MDTLEAGVWGFPGQPGLQSKALSINPVLVSEGGALAGTTEALSIPSTSEPGQGTCPENQEFAVQTPNQTHARSEPRGESCPIVGTQGCSWSTPRFTDD